MTDSIYMYVSPADSRASYPANEVNDFRVQLQNKIRLTGCWQIALLSVHIPQDHQYKGNPIYITCDKVVSAFVGESKLPILRRLDRPSEVIQQPYYVTIHNTEEISDFSFAILDTVTLNHASFRAETVNYTLHLRKHNHFNV